MAFCPNCGYEYVEGVQECPDCQVPLVESLPEQPVIKHEDQEYVGLYTLPGQVYAEMVKEALENAGISCFLKTDVISSGLVVKGATAPGNECQLFVQAKDKKRAEEILHGMMDHI